MIPEQADQFLDLNNFSNRTEHTGDFKKYGISHRKPQSKSKATDKDSRDQRYMMALIRQSKQFALKFVNDLQSCTYRDHTFQPEQGSQVAVWRDEPSLLLSLQSK